MSMHQFFKRTAVDPQLAEQLRTVTIPAPTRGLIMSENDSFIQPGAALVMDNWKPTMKGCALRGGHILWTQLPETVPVVSMFSYISANVQHLFAGTASNLYDVSSPVTGGAPAPYWKNSTYYAADDRATDSADGTVWVANYSQITGAAPLTFAQYRAAVPIAWTQTTTTSSVVKSGQTSGNYAASQLSNDGGDHLLVCNETGDYVLHFDGLAWVTYNAGQIHTDPALPVQPSCHDGKNLTYVWKYRNRYYFIEGGTMNAWYLPLNSIQGQLGMIPLSGSATKGGKLIAGFSWSIDAGDGIDDKCVFMTDQGELLIFTGSDPSTAANWRQEGRYTASAPLGMNAWTPVAGDVLLATVDGIIPISAAITKDASQLSLAAISRAVKPLWRNEVNLKRQLPWTMCKWDEYGGLFVTLPGGAPGNQYCAVINVETGAWCRYTGWDAMCFGRIRGNMFFGTQTGQIMQADRSGMDNGKAYTATLVGGWEMFASQSATIVWRQARAAFSARAGEPFQPQLSATTDYDIVIPTPPPAGPDPGPLDVWDQGLWASTPPDPDPTYQAKWDQPAPAAPTVRNTGWVSVGYTGFSHAPIVQVTVSQQAAPEVELISIAATYELCGVNV